MPDSLTVGELKERCLYIEECSEELRQALEDEDDDREIVEVIEDTSSTSVDIAKDACYPNPSLTKITLLLWIIDVLYKLLEGKLDHLPTPPPYDSMS